MNNAPDPQLEYLRVPPHSVEAEQSVLGGLLLDNAAWERVTDVVNEEDFYRFDHRLIWHHIARLINLSRAADVVTVHESIASVGKSDEVGGLAYLNALAHNTPSAANIRRYAEIVRERSMLRKLVSVADEIAATAFNPQGKRHANCLTRLSPRFLRLRKRGRKPRLVFARYSPCSLRS